MQSKSSQTTDRHCKDASTMPVNNNTNANNDKEAQQLPSVGHDLKLKPPVHSSSKRYFR